MKLNAMIPLFLLTTLLSLGAMPANAGAAECVGPVGAAAASPEESVVECIIRNADVSYQCLPGSLVCASASAWAGTFTSCALVGGGYGNCWQGGATGSASATGGVQGLLSGTTNTLTLSDNCAHASYCQLEDSNRNYPGTSVHTEVTVTATSTTLGLSISAWDDASA